MIPTIITIEYLQTLTEPATDKDLVAAICDFLQKRESLGDYKINPDGTVDSYSDVDISNMELRTIPVYFNEVQSYFNCANNKLSSLLGSPTTVLGAFYCSTNLLTNLSGAPNIVYRYFECSHNQLTSLVGAPTALLGSLKDLNGFNCNHNQLDTLVGCPLIFNGSLWCSNNRLTTLEGCPKIIQDVFNCNYNRLTSLIGGPTYVGGYYGCSGNRVRTLYGRPKIYKGDEFDCSNNHLIDKKYLPSGDTRTIISHQYKLSNGFYCS
jgi:hypothetical protein